MTGFKKAGKERSKPPAYCDLCQSAHYPYEAHSFRTSKPVEKQEVAPAPGATKKRRPLAKGKPR